MSQKVNKKNVIFTTYSEAELYKKFNANSSYIKTYEDLWQGFVEECPDQVESEFVILNFRSYVNRLLGRSVPRVKGENYFIQAETISPDTIKFFNHYLPWSLGREKIGKLYALTNKYTQEEIDILKSSYISCYKLDDL